MIPGAYLENERGARATLRAGRLGWKFLSGVQDNVAVGDQGDTVPQNLKGFYTVYEILKVA